MKITDVFGCVGWAVFFLLAISWIPIVGPFFSPLVPLPFLYYSTKLGFLPGVKLSALTVIVIGLIAKLAGQPLLILLCVEYSLLGIVLSELIRRKLNIGQTVFLATAFMLLFSFGVLFFLSLSRDIGPLEIILNYFEGHLEATINAYEEMGMVRENALELEAYGKVFLDAISKIYPSIIIIGTGFAVWLNLVLAKPLFRMGNLKYADFIPMDRWQAPNSLIWIVIVSGFALFLSSGSIRLVSINALIVAMVIYFFHGLSIILFYFNKFKVPYWIRVSIYFLIIIQQLFMAILALAGLFDQWIDFRKIYSRTES